MLKKVLISRISGNDKQTLGILTSQTFTCKTLELPDKNNARRVSCIPVGVYICRYTRSPLFSKKAGKDVYTYAIEKVPNRAGIRIHSANYARQLLGCVALGSAHKDLDVDGQLDVIHSGDTMRKFEEFMNKEDFELTIIKTY
jgi:hypothetical protein